MRSHQKWSTVARLALNLDLAIFALKLGLAIWFDVSAIQAQIKFNRRKRISDSDAVSQMFLSLMLFLAFSLTILVLHRLLATVSQYRNQNRISNGQNLKAAGCCCCSCCWFCLGIIHILILIFLIILIMTDMERQWLLKVAISLLFWEIVICSFMFIYKLSFLNVEESSCIF